MLSQRDDFLPFAHYCQKNDLSIIFYDRRGSGRNSPFKVKNL
jgi:hypothetical protein